MVAGLLLGVFLAAAAAATAPDPVVHREANAPAATTVRVDGSAAINEVRDEYLSYNLDSTDDRGFFSRNLDDKPLQFLASQLTRDAPAFLRVGGSGGDSMHYGVGNGTCPSVLRGRDVCLNTSHWERLNRFAKNTGVRLIWGLNPNAPPESIRSLLAYSKAQNFSIAALEPGNEDWGSGRESWRSSSFVSHFAAVVRVIKEVYPDPATRPRMVGPDMQSTSSLPNLTVADQLDMQAFLNITAELGEPALAGNYHAYLACLPPDQQDDAGFVRTGEQELSRLKGSKLPHAELWIGETAYGCSGGPAGEATFAGGFWWLNSLGALASTHKAFLRQTLIGGHYGILRDGDKCGVWRSHPAKPPCLNGSVNTCPTCFGGDGHNPVPFFPAGTVLGPNPDWWSAVLFKRLVGRRVLATTVAGPVTAAAAPAPAPAPAPGPAGPAPGAPPALLPAVPVDSGTLPPHSCPCPSHPSRSYCPLDKTPGQCDKPTHPPCKAGGGGGGAKLCGPPPPPPPPVYPPPYHASTNISAFSFCSRQHSGGVVIVFVNNDTRPADVTFSMTSSSPMSDNDDDGRSSSSSSSSSSPGPRHE
jgi:hypothetical protein